MSSSLTVGSCWTCPNRVSSRIAWMTSCSCNGTMPPVHAGAAPVPVPDPVPVPVPTAWPAPRGAFGTLPSGTIGTPSAPCPPPPPEVAPSAAAINCNNFCGSFSHCLNSGPSVCAAICAAMLTSPVRGSAATNFTSLILMVLFCLPAPNASLICLATSVAFDPATVNARTKRTKSSSVTSLEKCRLASPAVVSRVAKLFSAFPDSSGIPSSNSLLSETPRRKPASPPAGSAVCNSFHVVSNCASVRLCS